MNPNFLAALMSAGAEHGVAGKMARATRQIDPDIVVLLFQIPIQGAGGIERAAFVAEA